MTEWVEIAAHSTRSSSLRVNYPRNDTAPLLASILNKFGWILGGIQSCLSHSNGVVIVQKSRNACRYKLDLLTVKKLMTFANKFFIGLYRKPMT